MSAEETMGAGHWEQRYAAGDTPWDLGAPPPVLLDLIAGVRPAAQRVLVPGAGHGHDALAWARAGHRVTAVDISPTAVGSARARAEQEGVALEVVEGDLLALPAALTGAFDLVWEQTCFCALPPAQRPAYAEAVAAALRDGGRLLGLFWNCGCEGGPPYDVTPEAVRAVFGALFEIESLRPVTNSVAGREGESLVHMRKKAAGSFALQG